MAKPHSRADLHAHSKYSDRPSEWVLRRIGAPESFTEPLDLYRGCRARGMDFVTISDHNRIEGSLEIGHLPGVFISNEVTTYFPEDGCKVHCLVLGISESQFREIDEARRNIYEFRDYLYDHDILYSVAHPLFSVNDKLTVEHVERLLVLFKRFEGINGARDPGAAELFQAIARALNPRSIGKLADRHQLEPRDPEPWRKHWTAGSDDHGGLYLASAWTETARVASVPEYLAQVRAGATRLGGDSGSSLRLAHSFYAISWAYYRAKLLRGGKTDLISDLFARLVGDREVEAAATVSGPERLLRAAKLFIRPRPKRMGHSDRALTASFERLATLRGAEPTSTVDRDTFEEACRISQELTFAALRKLVRHARRGRLTESLQTLSALGPLAVCIAPYLAAFHTQHKDEPLLRALGRQFPLPAARARGCGTTIWMTENPASLPAGLLAAVAAGRRHDGGRLLVATTVAPATEATVETVTFAAAEIAELDFTHGGGRLRFPPFLEVLEWCERQRVTEIVVATAGPLGLVGVAAARLLGVPITAIYDRQLPAQVRQGTADDFLEAATWRYLRWFHDQANRLVLAAESDRGELRERGFRLDHASVLTPIELAAGALWAEHGEASADAAHQRIQPDREYVAVLDSY
jgi:hypothetical protein